MASEGPRSPATAVDDATIGTLAWSNPGNILASNNNRASRVMSGTAISHYLKATAFGFGIPGGATITGIVVEWEKHRTSGGAGTVLDSAIQIVKADGSIGTTNKATGTDWPNPSGSEAYVSYGGVSDLWGETWTPTDINDADFGAVLACTGDAASTETARVDHCQITVHSTVTTVVASVKRTATVAARSRTTVIPPVVR